MSNVEETATSHGRGWCSSELETRTQDAGTSCEPRFFLQDGERPEAMTRRRLVAGIGGAVVLSALVTGTALSVPAAGTVITIPAGLATSNPRLVPGAEVELFGLLNRARVRVHEGPLTMDPHLRSTARALSQDMAVHGFLGHVSSSGATLLQRLSAEARPGTVVGENVGLVPTAEEANRQFLASPGHRAVMLYPAFSHVGIGITTAGNGELMITEDFAQ